MKVDPNTSIGSRSLCRASRSARLRRLQARLSHAGHISVALELTRTDFNGPVGARASCGCRPGMMLGTNVVGEGESELVNTIGVAESVP